MAAVKPLTPEMERVLAIARRDGAACAGKGEHGGRVERVAASTIRALIVRGLLVHCYSSEGGYAGKLPPDAPAGTWGRKEALSYIKKLHDDANEDRQYEDAYDYIVDRLKHDEMFLATWDGMDDIAELIEKVLAPYYPEGGSR